MQFGERIIVSVPASVTDVGSARFTLYDIADAEVYVFVEPDVARTAAPPDAIPTGSWRPAAC
jgi:hypothetical protein